MTTKEELLKGEYSKLIGNPEKVYAQNPSIIQAAHTAMDEYASKTAIAFAEWIVSQEGDNKLTLSDNDWYWDCDTDGDQILTTEFLYTLFLEHINKEKKV